MGSDLRSIGAITLFVEDLGACKAFYEKVFAAAAVHEDENSAVFAFEGALVNLLAVSSAHGLIAPAQVAGPEAGARFQLSIWVEDADATCAELRARGVALLSGPMDRDWGKRTSTFADPAGHIWEIAQDIS
jgi:catechol 2,3-dioxygenase-like lactoylglutathione lyase family enzyme